MEAKASASVGWSLALRFKEGLLDKVFGMALQAWRGEDGAASEAEAGELVLM